MIKAGSVWKNEKFYKGTIYLDNKKFQIGDEEEFLKKYHALMSGAKAEEAPKAEENPNDDLPF
jgi:hypothetical protein